MKYSELLRAKLDNRRIGAFLMQLLDGCNMDTFEESRLAKCGRFSDRIRKCIKKYDPSIKVNSKYWLRPVFDTLYCGEKVRFISNSIAHDVDPLVKGLETDDFDHYDGFCKSPICPICSKLKSERIYARMRFNLENYINWDQYPEGVSFVFFTFSPPLYRAGYNFGNYFQKMRDAINHLDLYFGRDTVNHPLIGTFGNGEYTFSNRSGFESWSHPHWHCIFAFDNRYFKNPVITKSGRMTYFDINRNGEWQHLCSNFINVSFQRDVILHLTDEDIQNIPGLMKDEWMFKAEYLGSHLISRLPEICKYSTKFSSIQNADQLLVALQSMYGRHCRISTGIFKLTKDLEYAFKNYLNDVGEHYESDVYLDSDIIDMIENCSYELECREYQYIWIGVYDPENKRYNLTILDSVRKKE